MPYSFRQPFISKAGVGVLGNATVINRYGKINIWTGGADSAYSAYLRPSGTAISDYSTEERESSCAVFPCNDANNPGPNTQLISNRNAGNGRGAITDDLFLFTRTSSTTNHTDPAENEFFGLFFKFSKQNIKDVADSIGQYFPAGSNGSDLNGKAGLIWVDGNISINAMDVIGTRTRPVILIIDGNLDPLNGATIFGVVYITGTLEIVGNPIIKGSIIAENPATSTGTGALTLVYNPWFT